MKKLLSMLMSIVLVVGLMPLPAYANDGASAGALASGEASADLASNAGTGSAVATADSNSGGLIAAASPDLTAQGGSDVSMVAQGDDREYDVVGDLGWMDDPANGLSYQYLITSVEEGDRTATLYSVSYQEEFFNPDGKSFSEWYNAAKGTVDFTVPATITSTRGFTYDVTSILEVKSDLVKSITVPATVTITEKYTQPGYGYSDRARIGGEGCQTITFAADSPITSIPEEYFNASNEKLTTVTFPKGLKVIGANAFANCPNLKSVDLGENLVEIGDDAFFDTHLPTITFPSTLVTIGDRAFGFGRWTTGLQMDELVIPDSVESIGEFAFASCYSYTNEDHTQTYYASGINDKDHHPDGVWDEVDWTAPGAEYNRDNYTGLVAHKSIKLGKNLKSIGMGAFEGSAITTIELPASLEEIGIDAFGRSWALTSITWEDVNRSQMRTFGGFYECVNLTSVEIPTGTETIGPYAFNRAGLKSVTIPGSVGEVQHDAFDFSAIESLTIRPGSTPLALGSYAFAYCEGLAGSTIELPRRVDTLDVNTFARIPDATYKIYNDELSMTDTEENPYVAYHARVTYTMPTADIPASEKGKWEDYDDGGNTTVSIPDPWCGLTVTSGGQPDPDLRNVTIYYPDSLDMSTSFALWAYVQSANEQRAIWEAGTYPYGLVFNMPKFIPMSANPDNPDNQPKMIDDTPTGTLEVVTEGAGGIDANICVFDADGKLAVSGHAQRGFEVFAGVATGTYTVAAFANNSRFSSVGSLSDFAAMGLAAGEYATQAGVTIKQGESTTVTLTVPTIKAATLTNVVEESSVVIGKTSVLMGTEVYATASFRLKEGLQAEKLVVKLPAGVEPTSAYSERTDFGLRGWDEETRTLTVTLDGTETDLTGLGRVWVGVKPVEPGRFSVNASVVAGGVTAPSGNSSFKCEAVGIDVPNEPVYDSKREFPVTVYAAPGSYVDVTVAGNTFNVGPTNKNGKYATVINAREPFREDAFIKGIETTTSSYTVMASIRQGDQNYTATGLVTFRNPEEQDVILQDFSFIHAGAKYFVVKDGSRMPRSSYYVYIANGRSENEFWTFSATYTSKRKMGGDATVQVQMLDGRSRYAKMPLVSQSQQDDGQWTATYATTMQIEQAGDHVFPASLVPTGFDVYYKMDAGLPDEGVELTQAEVDWIKAHGDYTYLYRCADPELVAQEDDAIDELFADLTFEEREAIRGADQSIALFGGGYIEHMNSENEYLAWIYCLSLWELMMEMAEKGDTSLKETLENIPDDGVDTISSDPAKGPQDVGEIWIGCTWPGDNTEPTVVQPPTPGEYGGVIGTVDECGQLMYNEYYTGMATPPRECENADDYVTRNVGPDNPFPTDWLNNADWTVVSDGDVDGATSGLTGVGTPVGGDILNGDRKSPEKFGIRINRDEDGIPKNFEFVDTNGNHYQLNVPGIMQEAYRMVDGDLAVDTNLAKKLGSTYATHLEERGKQGIADCVHAINEVERVYNDVDAEIEGLEKRIRKNLSKYGFDERTFREQDRDYYNAQRKLLADGKVMFDSLVQKLIDIDWQDIQKQVEEQEKKRDVARKKLVRYMLGTTDGISQECIEAMQAYLDALKDLYRDFSEKTSALDAEISKSVLAQGLGLIPTGCAYGFKFKKTFENFQGMSKEGLGKAAQTLAKKVAQRATEIYDKYNDMLERCQDTDENARNTVIPILDPSGVAYESISGEPLEGVTVTLWDLGDYSTDPVLWDAEEYDQVNPQVTNKNGTFGWDVPRGRYKVTFEKDGYNTETRTGLEVPPPQTDVFVGMAPNTAPNALTARATASAAVAPDREDYKDFNYVEVEFNQYIDLLLPIEISVNGVAVPSSEAWSPAQEGSISGEIEGEPYDYSKVVRVPVPAGVKLGDALEVTVTTASNYVGTPLAAPVTFKDVKVEMQPGSLSVTPDEQLQVPVGESTTLTANVSTHAPIKGEPNSYMLEPLAGARVTATLDNPYLAELVQVEAVTDAAGDAAFVVNGLLPGMSTMTISVEGAALSESVDVLTTMEQTQVARPTATIGDTKLGVGAPSENWIETEKGSLLELACSTPGAQIFYTTDGTCPCEILPNQQRFEYTAPVKVNEDTFFIIGGMKEGMYDSEKLKIHVTVTEPKPTKTTWKRLWGNDALDTMAAIVGEGFESSDVVVVATKDGYWDALAASALAGANGAPVLLTDGKALSDKTRSEIARLGATKAYICGEKGAVSAKVESDLRGMGLASVKRLGGDTAVETAEKISAQARADSGGAGGACVIATIDGFYDSLSMAPGAYALGMPVYLTGWDHRLAASTLDAIKEAGYRRAVIVGGAAAVDPGVEGQLVGTGMPADAIERLWGDNAWQTSQRIAEWGLAHGMSADLMGVADGNGYWDALTGAALCGINGSVLVLVPHDGPIFDYSMNFGYDPYCIDKFVRPHAAEIATGYVFGGQAVVPDKPAYEALVAATAR